jgi:hypothetical protein
MALLVVSMLAVTALAVAVVGVVALPAHRGGRGMLTARGERVARSARRRFTRLRHPHARTH